MRRWIVYVCSIAVLATVAVVWQSRGRLVQLSQEPSSKGESISMVAVGVDALMRNVGDYRSSIVLVEGVVSARDPANRIFGLIDTSEFEECGVTNCATLTLPVRWSGAMPQEGETVRVTGTVRQDGSRLVFVAQAVESTELA